MKVIWSGDYFVLDNARLHSGDKIFDLFTDLMSAYNVKPIFLPKYANELNPAELAFAFIKNHLRNRRKVGDLFELSLAKAIGSITANHLWAFYHHCFFSW